MRMGKRIIGIQLASPYPRWPKLSLFILMAAAVMAGPSGFLAAEGDLPSGEAVFDKYVEVTGGLKAYGNIHNMFARGTFKLVQAGITASISVYSAEPNLLYTKIESKTLGVIKNGFNGEVAWETSLMTGPRIKEGEERKDALRDNIFQGEARWREIYLKAENTGLVPVDGRPCYKVVMTPKTGRPVTLFFDRESNLMVKVERTFANQMGLIKAEIYMSDYKRVDGILVPHVTKTKFMGQEMIMSLEKVEANVKLPEGVFDLPEEIQALIKKEKKGN